MLNSVTFNSSNEPEFWLIAFLAPWMQVVALTVRGAPASLPDHPRGRGRDAAPSWQHPPPCLLHPCPHHVKWAHCDRRAALVFTHALSSSLSQWLQTEARAGSWDCVCFTVTIYIYIYKPFYSSDFWLCVQLLETAQQVVTTDEWNVCPDCGFDYGWNL